MSENLPFTILIRSDPMVSHRPAEALRVAIGLSGGDAEKINILFMDDATAIVSEDPFDFEEGEAIEGHLEAMNEYGMRFYVEDTSFSGKHTTPETQANTIKVSLQDIAEMLRRSRNVLIF